MGLGAKHARHAYVCYLGGAISRQKHVRRLQVQVDYLGAGMQVGQATSHIQCNLPSPAQHQSLFFMVPCVSLQDPDPEQLQKLRMQSELVMLMMMMVVNVQYIPEAATVKSAIIKTLQMRLGPVCPTSTLVPHLVTPLHPINIVQG